jgi:hypothetical protein
MTRLTWFGVAVTSCRKAGKSSGNAESISRNSGKTSEDLRGLRLLKDRLGSRLQEAIVLYTGEHAYRHDGWIWIMPLSRLWTY